MEPKKEYCEWCCKDCRNDVRTFATTSGATMDVCASCLDNIPTICAKCGSEGIKTLTRDGFYSGDICYDCGFNGEPEDVNVIVEPEKLED